jgi:5-methylcytosine-specific restriction endonuclease McrBC regulatory subunit McrC
MKHRQLNEIIQLTYSPSAKENVEVYEICFADVIKAIETLSSENIKRLELTVRPINLQELIFNSYSLIRNPAHLNQILEKTKQHSTNSIIDSREQIIECVKKLAVSNIFRKEGWCLAIKENLKDIKVLVLNHKSMRELCRNE